MAKNKYARRLVQADTAIEAELYSQAVTTAAGAVELLLKDLVAELGRKSPEAANELVDALRPYSDRGKMTLGKWVAFYRQARMYDWLEREFGYDFHLFNPGSLSTVRDIRNECAHKDFEPTSAQAKTIRHFLAVFLEETNRAPKDIKLLFEPTPQPQPQPLQSVASLPAWRHIAVPHRDVRERRFDLGVFAIHLGEIAFGAGGEQAEYADAHSFFDLTYITRGLRGQLVTMMQRLAKRRPGFAVVQLDTSFGGGKTHTLLSMYHLAKSGDRLRHRDDIRALMNEARVDRMPECAVAVLDGSHLDPKNPRNPEPGIQLRTLWGEMAYQLGGAAAYAYMRDSDESPTAPGARILGEMLRALDKPSLILMDEVLDYATKAASVRVGRNTYLVDQVQSFLKALTQAVDRHGASMLALTLTNSPLQAFGTEARRLQDKLDEHRAVFGNILERVQRSEVVAENVEIYEILRRRLFETVGEPAPRENVAAAYARYYRENSDHVPAQAVAPDYGERMAASYPFHPDLIDVLRDRWGTIPSFQKTRGVLRLLALVVSNLYRGNHDAPLIQAGHVDLADPEIRRELLAHVDNPPGYDTAIGSDIAGTATSKAAQRDITIGKDYFHYHLCQGLATTMFLYSHSGSTSDTVSIRGGTRPQLALGILQPDIGATLALDVFDKLEAELWYMQRQGAYLRIGVEANLNKMLTDYHDHVTQDRARVHERIRDEIAKVAGSALGRAYVWEADPGKIRDDDSLALVIAPQDRFGLQENDAGLDYINAVLGSAGSAHRRYRNALVFLLSTPNGVEMMEKAATRLLALEEIKASRGSQFRDQQKEELKARLESALSGMPAAIWGAYRMLACADDKALWTQEIHDHVYHPGDSLAQRAEKRLLQDERLLTKIDPRLLIMEGDNRFEYLWLDSKDCINTLELWLEFARYARYPMLAHRGVLADAIHHGVREGLFGYTTGDPPNMEQLKFQKRASAEIAADAWLVKESVARSTVFPPAPEPLPTPDPHDDDNGRIAPGPQPDPVPPEPRPVRRIDVEISLQPSDWRSFHQFVIAPLVAKGAENQITVKLSARRNEGFDQDFLNLTLQESLTQINPSVRIIKD